MAENGPDSIAGHFEISGDLGNEWRHFMDDGEDFPNIIRIDSADIVYQQPHASFIGEKYLKGELLGEGSYSKVKEVLDIETLCRRAAKIVKYRTIRRIPNGIANVKREINIMKRLNHRNVIRLIEDFYNEEKMKKYMILEYCCCNLQAMLDKCEPKMFPEWQSHYYFCQLIEGIDYLHSQRIIHKDIKPANLLLTVDQVLKITDLGVSEQLDRFAKDDTITTSQGSPVSQSPEIAAGDESFSGFKIDIWSCGITLYRMCTTTYPFDGESICKLYDNIAKAEYTIPDHVPELLQQLLKGMLAKTSEERLSITEIRNTLWFQQRKPIVEQAIPMPAEEGNPAFSMTVLSNLKLLVMPEEAANEMPDDEQVVNATEVYNMSNSASANPEAPQEVSMPESNHRPVQAPSHRKHKKCLIS